MQNQERYYKDLREWLAVLKKNDMLYTISDPLVKETEISPLVRLQFRGIPEERRKGFLFENVVDVKGRRYECKLATGIFASSMKMYAMALMCEPTREAITEKWMKAQLKPIDPVVVNSGPVQEHVYQGDELLKDGRGVEYLPIPVELPGFSGQIRTTTQVITMDPKTRVRNMGNYSGMVSGKTKLQWDVGPGQHGTMHRKAWKELGKPMPMAIVIGGPPTFLYAAGTKFPYGLDELTIAGGFAGEPIELVKCKTIDLEVPAHAEIVIEGIVSDKYAEPSNAFGEYTGYMATDTQAFYPFQITCITYRNNPIFAHITSQFPPSESSKLRQIGYENENFKRLKYDFRLPGIQDLAWHEMSQAHWCVISVKKVSNAHPWQVLYSLTGADAREGKFYIVVDQDINPHDIDSVIWALSFRVQPDRDMRIVTGRIPGLDVSAYRPDDTHEEKNWPRGVGSSALLIDATMKHPYPPTALPRKQFMDNALKIWDRLGLPNLELKQPWYGYELGYWPAEFEEDAQLILKGEHYKVGERLEKMRKAG